MALKGSDQLKMPTLFILILATRPDFELVAHPPRGPLLINGYNTR